MEEAGVVVSVAIAAAEGRVVHRAELGALDGGALSLALHCDLGLGPAGGGAEVALTAVGLGIGAADRAVLHSAGNVAVVALTSVGNSDGRLGLTRVDLEAAVVAVGVAVRAAHRVVDGRAGDRAVSCIMRGKYYYFFIKSKDQERTKKERKKRKKESTHTGTSPDAGCRWRS